MKFAARSVEAGIGGVFPVVDVKAAARRAGVNDNAPAVCKTEARANVLAGKRAVCFMVGQVLRLFPIGAEL